MKAILTAPESRRSRTDRFSDHPEVVSKAVDEVARVIAAVEGNGSLELNEKDLYNILFVSSEGIHGGANEKVAWDNVEKLPSFYKTWISPGELVEVGVKDLQLTMKWSTPEDPYLTGKNIFITHHLTVNIPSFDRLA